MSKKSETVRVVVRCRPMLQDEISSKFTRVVGMDVARGMITIKNPKARAADELNREFTFDAVYDWNSKQSDLYDETFRPIVEAVLEGYNGTIFAYGQTGTGKTYTMEGIRNKLDERGVIPNSFSHIFTHISRSQDEQYLVRASYLEIYQEEIRDLLNKDHKNRLELRERTGTGVYVKDLSSFVAKSIKEIEHVMSVGNKNRSVGPTDMNKHSSRSHAIFIVTVECSARGDDGDDHIRVGKLNLVDLAGSERQSKTGSTGIRFKEATKINLSLSCLGNVIAALVDGKSSYVPYRDSKLTRLLQDSLGGNAKTVMVANVGPAGYNYEETLMTLRYANRAKNIKNKPIINEDPKDALLREYQEEIMRLKMALETRKKKGGEGGHRKKRSSVGGEEGASEESEGEGGEEREGEQVTLKTRQVELEGEKMALLQNNELLKEEREKLLSEVQRREDLLKKEQKKREQLNSKIKAMESKLLAGSVLERSDETKNALEKKRQEVIEQRRREREVRQQLEEKEESNLEIKGTFTSLQEEVELKTKKLNKLKSKLKAARAEMADYMEEQFKVKEDLALTLESLQREQKLRSLIVENFIPPVETEKVVGRAVYSEEEEDWRLRPYQAPSSSDDVFEGRPMSSKSTLHPISTYAKLAAQKGDPRFMADNILKVELDLPNRTTRDYEAPTMISSLQAALDAALQEEEEMTFDATAFNSSSKHRNSRGRKGKENSSQQPQQPSGSSHGSAAHGRVSSGDSEAGRGGTNTFPTSRGLVSRPVRFA